MLALFVVEIFFDREDAEAHIKFHRWRQRHHQDGYYLNYKGPRDSTLHRAPCWHLRAQRALGPRRQRRSRQLEPDQESLLHLWARIGRVGQREGRDDSCETLPGLMNLSLRWPQVAISVG